MSYKPDYGLRQMNDGISRDVDHLFHDFRLYNLAVLGGGTYSTMVEIPYDGEIYALSLDFNQKQLEQILLKAQPQLVKKGDVHAERAPLKAWRGQFLGEKDWEREVTVGKGQGKTSTWLGTSRTNVPMIRPSALSHKLARAAYYVMRDQVPFRPEKLFG